ncbi:MAG: MFS transporter [Propionibacteriaceae bacterium]|jgi:MFS family permease|nr:MFS transporter [Propionibacteriaceae bacterium]
MSSAETAVENPVEKRVIRKMYIRLVPFLIIAYFVNYIDRTNLSFASLEMNADLNLSQTAFGLGAGLFFVTYVVLEVPSNIILEKVGARKWIARIMITWGIISGCMAFIQNEVHFYIVRLLLGAAEAGFFPGMIFYLSIWFPIKHRARIQGVLLFAVPFSITLGAPVSGLLLGVEAFGFVGWQIMYILEALPAVIIGLATFIWLTDRPEVAKWLPEDEKQWLVDTLAREKEIIAANSKQTSGKGAWKLAFMDWRVWMIILGDIALCALNTGVGTFLPQIIKGLGIPDNFTVTVITAIPYAIAAVALLLWTRHSDKTGERKWHIAGPMGTAAILMAGSVFIPDPVAKIVCLGGAMVCLYCFNPVLWTLPLSFLTGAAAASGVALINACGNIANFPIPYAIGYLKDATGSYDPGLFLVAILAAIGTVAILIVGQRKYIKPPEEQLAEA